jgi:hypothetical protein
MRIVRKIFLVPLANNNRGKSTIVKAMVGQGLGQTIGLHKKGVRSLTSPWGRPIDAFAFGRSYQEVEKNNHDDVEATLDANDSKWRDRELIVMPSHIGSGQKGDVADAAAMIEVAHGAGFDAICASVLLGDLGKSERRLYSRFWRLPWDERWTIPNPEVEHPNGQLEALGHDLWSWVCRALVC